MIKRLYLAAALLALVACSRVEIEPDPRHCVPPHQMADLILYFVNEYLHLAKLEANICARMADFPDYLHVHCNGKPFDVDSEIEDQLQVVREWCGVQVAQETEAILFNRESEN